MCVSALRTSLLASLKSHLVDVLHERHKMIIDHVPGVEEVRHSVLIPPLDVFETLLRKVVSFCNLLQVSFPCTGVYKEP